MLYLIIYGCIMLSNPTIHANSSAILVQKNTNLSPVFTNSPHSSGNLAPGTNSIDTIPFTVQPNQTKQGILNSSSYHIFWFLQITDIQMAWYKWGQNVRRGETDGRYSNVRTFFNTTQKVISPLFIVNTGDLIDSSYETYFARTIGQRDGEWAYYNETISATGVNVTYYFDMPGNHDVYRDHGYLHFLNYSFSGNAFQTDQYMIKP